MLSGVNLFAQIVSAGVVADVQTVVPDGTSRVDSDLAEVPHKPYPTLGLVRSKAQPQYYCFCVSDTARARCENAQCPLTARCAVWDSHSQK